MKKNHTAISKIGEHLSGSHNSLATIFEKASLLRQLNDLFKNAIDPELAKHCLVANYRSSILVVEAQSAAWAMQIRYRANELIKNLRALDVFKKLERIECYILPNSESLKTIPDKTINLSKEDAELLISTSESIKNPALKNALLRLAKRENL